jgi:hypothetical protein
MLMEIWTIAYNMHKHMTELTCYWYPNPPPFDNWILNSNTDININKQLNNLTS